MTESEILHCVNHPKRETLLRCNQCEQPICIQCAVLTPTGYRCKSCVRGQQKKFNTAKASDLFLAPFVAGILSLIGSFIIRRLGFLTLFLAPFIGIAIERSIRVVIKNRRSTTLFLITSGAVLFGSIPLLAAGMISFFYGIGTGSFNIYSLLPLLWQGAYTIMVTGSVYYRLKGISL